MDVYIFNVVYMALLTCDERTAGSLLQWAGVSNLDMSSLIMTVYMGTVWSEHVLQMMMLRYIMPLLCVLTS